MSSRYVLLLGEARGVLGLDYDDVFGFFYYYPW